MKFSQAFVLLFAIVGPSLSIPTAGRNLTNSPRNALPASDFTYEPIKTGYVAFGDSYAAGIGAGPTTGDGCRVGDFSHPNLLNTWAGVVATDLLQGTSFSQIDKWQNPEKADRATLSIGGNDIGFYNVLTSCVLRVGMFAAGDCDKFVREAYTKMSSDVFTNNVYTALQQIITKSGRSDFKIIHTGYPTFFNNETASYTTFYYWQPGHHSIHHGGNWAYLYKSLRTKLNKLVTDLDEHLSAIVDAVNRGFDQPRVIFLDPNDAFEGHRFCEPGITEPDKGNEGNWLFLSSWPDTSIAGTDSAHLSAVSEETESALQLIHGIPTPDEATCESTHDWDILTTCEIMKAGITLDNGGTLKLVDTVALPDGNKVSTKEIPWYTPTKSAKTFHPRTLGHMGMRDLIRATW